MNFTQAIASGFSNYVTFSGRAARSQYWYWVLFYALGKIVAMILDLAIFHIPLEARHVMHPLSLIFALIMILPTFAVAIRRLHDVNRSGWWLLMYFTIIGIIYPLLVWKCTKGTEGDNRFGPDPLAIY